MKKIFLQAMLLVVCIQTSQNLFAIPPRNIPNEHFDRFTMNGKIPVLDYYLDGSYVSENPRKYTVDEIKKNISLIHQRKNNYYGNTDSCLYDAIEKHHTAILDKSIAIIGSVTPWYESIALAYGGSPTTIEYNTIISDDPRLEIMTAAEYSENPKLFDCIFSISSYEHDGLGRYGDPINPDGDLLAMANAKTMLKENGLLFLAVPIGQDLLCWNAHRIYGRIRLPKLLEGWEIVDSFGFDENNFNRPLAEFDQPVFVLRVINNNY